MPRVHGDGFIHIKDVNFIIRHDEPLLELPAIPLNETTQRIGNYVARLVQDGDTIQVGYGGLPNAVMANLFNKKHLGVHTELLSDGLVDLIKAGVIDNSRKKLNPRMTVAAFSHGEEGNLRIPQRQPLHSLSDHRLYERPAQHRPAGQHGRHQQLPGNRSHRPGHIGFDRRHILQRHRRSSGFHAGRPAVQRRPDHPRDEIHGQE